MAGHCRLRPIVPADLDALVALERASFSDHWTAEQLTSAMGWPEVLGLVAEDDVGVAGYLLGRVVVDHGEILSLAVLPGRRRAGIGRQLLAGALGVMAARSVAVAWLEVRVSNAAARALYRSAGFAESGLRRDYYRHPTEDALVLRSDIAQFGHPVRQDDA
jgi:ribosomal-protein-alanine N-acetyltransferase